MQRFLVRVTSAKTGFEELVGELGIVYEKDSVMEPFIRFPEDTGWPGRYAFKRVLEYEVIRETEFDDFRESDG